MNVYLLEGKTVRTRNSEGCTVLSCGCAHGEVRWLQLCSEHWFEWSGLHDAARIAHAATMENGV